MPGDGGEESESRRREGVVVGEVHLGLEVPSLVGSVRRPEDPHSPLEDVLKLHEAHSRVGQWPPIGATFWSGSMVNPSTGSRVSWPSSRWRVRTTALLPAPAFD